ncbi:MAG: asparagine synthetase B [Bacteroidota bacterium]|nr:asparagine synthetase B [Bacteroidota bacterium]MEC7813766.1 asparagine synthetase B [Bacteroidota bacterium]MEC7955128.1 asparagine synthetase B [Bacteroidota bacterium]MEC8031618.1 asparagine synthetase B [Bacteroidota bacterium]|tara:strand:- start:253 stop:1437 length:1185 start_codon:yes stop_codon:yes gene_type:complete
MDEESQRNHLKAYGIAYWILQNEIEVEWLLNYRGGSFLVTNYNSIQEECTIRGVTYELITDAKVNAIKTEISDPEVNMEVVKLEKAPKIAVYTPQGKQPWDDAVTLVLTYAEIPYDEIYDKEVVENQLFKYEWLHLHHEDFTGQYGKFYRNYKNAPWYKKQQSDSEQRALSLGFEKVSHLKLQVSKNIKEFVAGGGFLFTMCSGTDSYDIALSAENTDICEHMFDGDKADPQAQSKLNYNNTLAFKNFKLKMNPLEYEFSDIDGTTLHRIPETQDLFTLFEFSAKWDIVPTLLCQNHTNVIKGFMGQTTDFKTSLIKSDVLIMGESKALKTARYIHGEFGKGQWTFYGGHDPEDYRHFVNDPPTDLNLYPNSPGYRLILNNILFPAAKKKKQKT